METDKYINKVDELYVEFFKEIMEFSKASDATEFDFGSGYDFVAFTKPWKSDDGDLTYSYTQEMLKHITIDRDGRKIIVTGVDGTTGVLNEKYSDDIDFISIGKIYNAVAFALEK